MPFESSHITNRIHVPASSKWPFDSPNGGHLSPVKVTYGSKRGHFEEAGMVYLPTFIVNKYCRCEYSIYTNTWMLWVSRTWFFKLRKRGHFCCYFSWMLAKTQRRCSSIVPFHSHEPVVFGFYEFVGRDPHGTQCTTSELDTHKRVLYKIDSINRFSGAYCKLANLKYIIVYKYLSTREVASKLQTCTVFDHGGNLQHLR